jgi:hypothetical protein
MQRSRFVTEICRITNDFSLYNDKIEIKSHPCAAKKATTGRACNETEKLFLIVLDYSGKRFQSMDKP